MRNTYFWNDALKEVIVKNDVILGSEAVYLGLTNMHSIDEFNVSDMYRYGMYDLAGKWRHIPLEQFPPEFRSYLLLIT